MKSRKVWLIGPQVALLIICFTFGTAHSQDLSGWVGKWFKLNYNSKGYETFTNPTHTPETQSLHRTLYLKVTAWDTTNPNNQFLRCSSYSKDGEEIYEDTVDLIYLGGTDLDFIILCHISGEVRVGFTARITGKGSIEALKSAAFKTLGGYSWQKSSDPISNPRDSIVGGLTITGALISESKLPPWVPK